MEVPSSQEMELESSYILDIIMLLFGLSKPRASMFFTLVASTGILTEAQSHLAMELVLSSIKEPMKLLFSFQETQAAILLISMELLLLEDIGRMFMQC